MEIVHLPSSASGAEIAEVLRRDGAVVVDEMVVKRNREQFL